MTVLRQDPVYSIADKDKHSEIAKRGRIYIYIYINFGFEHLAYLLLISAAIVRKACSTFVAFFALVSRNGILRLSANSYTRDGIRNDCNSKSN